MGRKEATAIVQIYPIGANEKSEILINNCLAEVFLQFNAAYLNTLNRSLALLNLENNYRIIVKTRGGGLTGQTGAIQLGLARALCKIDPNYRSTLKSLIHIPLVIKLVLCQKKISTQSGMIIQKCI